MPKSLPPDETWCRSAYSRVLGVDGSDPTITLTPASDERAYLDWVMVSYAALPGVDDVLTISIDGTDVFTYRVGVVASVQGDQFFGPWYGAKGEVIVVTLTVAGAALETSIAAKYRLPVTVS